MILSELEVGHAYRKPNSSGIWYKVIGIDIPGTVPVIKTVTHYFATKEVQCIPISPLVEFDPTYSRKFSEALLQNNLVLVSAVAAGTVIQFEGLDDYTALFTSISNADDAGLVAVLGFPKNEDEDTTIIDLGVGEDFDLSALPSATTGDAVDLILEHLGIF